jgi:hypothetical protein
MVRKTRLDIERAGSKIGTIPVFMGYRIIDLFSGRLYSNPAKAIEELVVNSYDAFAKACQVVVPEDWSSPTGQVLVWDDGESMDLQGLRELWLIADTLKRDPKREERARAKGRLSIGKFGIGKLASYVLGDRISHVCKRNNQFLVVTMDFSTILPRQSKLGKHGVEKPKEVKLSVRRLRETEAMVLLEFATNGNLPGGVKLPLFGHDAPRTWTLVIVDRLKEERKKMSKGRLEWIISTALPLVPDFQVFLNGNEVPPSKLDKTILKEWIVGKDDQVAKERGYEVGSDAGKPDPFESWVEIPLLGKLSGKFTLFKETLLTGKASETGRSHGFFVMVRRRLINHDEPLFGIHALSHQTFNRLHAVIHADGLDETLVASRESVSEESRKRLEEYLVDKFNEIRQWYENWVTESTRKEGIPERLSTVPGVLARFPLKHAVDRVSHERDIASVTIKPAAEGKTPEDIIRVFELSALDSEEPLAIFDASTGTVKINTNHPYYLNFSESQSPESMEVLATTEILLEAYLLDTSLSPDEVQDVVERRDQLLRALVRERPFSVSVIAQQLRDSTASPVGAEIACHHAFRALGFGVIPLGGKGKPDGIASAILAAKYGKKLGEIEKHSYKIAYDAKSSVHEKVKSGNLTLSGVKSHRDDWNADYAVVIAPDFQTADGDESKAVKEATQEEVTLIRANDFADLIEVSGVKPLPLDMLEELFKCRSPDDSHRWIESFRLEKTPTPVNHIRIILETIYKLQKERPSDPPSYGAIQLSDPRLKDVSERQIKEWVRALQRLQPDLITLYGEKVELNQTPEIIVHHFQQSLQEIERKIEENKK